MLVIIFTNSTFILSLPTKRSITDCLRCITTQITAEIQYTMNKT